jgi:CheY-like chemotaxis protein
VEKVKSVLLIDDDEATNFLNKVILSRSKRTDNVIPYQKAEEALRFLESAEKDKLPELIFLDINMPLMDGWEFMNRYQNLSKDRKKSVIIMLTSSINPDDKSKAQRYKDINDYRTKPLSTHTIDEIFTKFFSKG